jgi:hypothetical protein
MAYINDPSDRITLNTGFATLRDAYTRVGAVLFSVRENARAKLGHPLLKWYFSGNQLDANFEVPGQVAVFNMLSETTSTATGIPLGTLAMHYKVRVRAPRIQGIQQNQFSGDTASMAFVNAAVNADQPITISTASAGLAANLTTPGVVYWGTIAASSDPAGVALWRSWIDNSTTDFVLDVGNILYWRVDQVGTTVYFFPTLADAFSVDWYALAANFWSASQTVAPGVAKGFKLWNIMGTPVGGAQA